MGWLVNLASGSHASANRVPFVGRGIRCEKGATLSPSGDVMVDREDRRRETLTPPKIPQTLYQLEGPWK